MRACTFPIVLAAILAAAGCGDNVAPGRPTCGDGIVNGAEECDGGGPGCSASCTFACTNDPAAQCAGTAAVACQQFACGADHSCVAVVDMAQNGRACDATQPDNVCVNGACKVSTCGDGVRGSREQCDDENQFNLDGCDSACQFEESQRIVKLEQQFVTDTFCPQNALGAAIAPESQESIQGTWDMPITDGSLSLIFKFLGLQDLTGGDTPFTLGFVKARAAGRTSSDALECGNGVCEESEFPGQSEFGGTNPSETACPADCAYDGNNDLDWWYIREPASVKDIDTPNETPIEQLSGEIRGGHLTAGPGTISVNLLFALSPATVTLFDTKVDAAVDGQVSAPMAAASGLTRGHPTSERLDPNLKSVEGSTTGAICSNVSAASLFNTPIPDLLQTTCARDDAGNDLIFTKANTLLDVFINGCTIFAQPGVIATQPDGSRDGAIYRFTVDPTTLKVNGCTKDDNVAVLDDCLQQTTFSSYFKFAADRVIIKRN